MLHSTVVGAGCGQTLFFVNALTPSTTPKIKDEWMVAFKGPK